MTDAQPATQTDTVHRARRTSRATRRWSASSWARSPTADTMAKAAAELEERGIKHEMQGDERPPRPRRGGRLLQERPRIRGLKVVIAGAGLAAALPGTVAAHTDLPVIGVPLQSQHLGGRRPGRHAGHRPDAPRRARGLRRAWTAPRTPRCSRRRILVLAPVIGRYTRPEMGAVWSEQRKLENWLAVELAVTDALAEAGVVPADDAEAIRANARLHGRGGQGAREGHRPRRGRVRGRGGRLGGRGRAAGCTTA